METMMEVDVLLLCTRTVTKQPIMSPTTGFVSSSLDENT